LWKLGNNNASVSVPTCGWKALVQAEGIGAGQKLEYLSNIFSNKIAFPQIRMREDIAAQLGVETSILELLSPKTCVLAGGCVLKIACPDTPFLERCDIDIFVLWTKLQEATVGALLRALKATGRTIFSKGKSVFNAIGAFGIRRVQVIVSGKRKAKHVIQDFDFAALLAYYDGTAVQAMFDAQQSWRTRVCEFVPFTRISPLRLFAMQWKGFKIVDPAADKYLNDSIGNPPRESIVNDFLQTWCQ
jgi:hypothetical protein